MVFQRNMKRLQWRVSVIRLPNNRFWSKAFHINKKINHLSTSPGWVSISHVFFHATSWISGLTEYLHMESHLSLFLWIYWRVYRREKCDPSAALSHQCRLSSGFPPRHNGLLGRGEFWVLFPHQIWGSEVTGAHCPGSGAGRAGSRTLERLTAGFSCMGVLMCGCWQGYGGRGSARTPQMGFSDTQYSTETPSIRFTPIFRFRVAYLTSDGFWYVANIVPI